MAWNMTGAWYESCSCKMVCRCTLGPAEPDQGWCSALQVYDVERGVSDGVDLAGVRLAVALDLPGDFFGGIDAARLYFDEALNAAQARELEAIFTGKKGGVWEAVGGMVKTFHPPRRAKIEIKKGEGVSVTVGEFGRVELKWLKTEDGKQAKLTNAPVMAAFGVDTAELATAHGSGGSDPEMRKWESLGFGSRVPFSWST